MSNATVGPALTTGATTTGPNLTGAHRPLLGPGVTGVIIRTVSGDIMYFEYTQSVPAGDWYVTHNLGKYPNVEIIDSGGNAILADVNFVDLNTVHVTFAGMMTGKVVCS